MPDAIADRRPIKRSRHGCLTCRQRRVKCDETPLRCQNCKSLSLECRYERSPSASLSGHDGPSTVRHIAATSHFACDACRSARVRCSRHRPICEKCLENGLNCVYRKPAATKNDDLPLTQTLPAPVVSTLPSGIELDQLTNAFFQHVYPVQANAFVRRADLYSEIQTGKVDTILLKAICAVAFRYTTRADTSHPDGGAQAAQWADEARSGLMLDADRFARSKIAAILLLIWHDNNSGRYGSAWLLIALASRMVVALGLASESVPETPWIEQERGKRLAWAVYAQDNLGAGGVAEYSTCPSDPSEVPCSERYFALGIAPPVTSENSIGDHSIQAHFLKLLVLRKRILRYTKFHLEIMPVKAWATPSEFQVLLEALGQWKAGLPPELALTTSNLFARQATAEFESLISLHALHDQLYGDLYRIALPGFPESASVGYLADAPVDWVTRVRFGCYVRALALTDKFKLLKQYFPHYTPVDRLWRMFAYESIRNQLQYLHVTTVAVQQSEGEREETVSGFETIVETIGKMTTYYSSMTSLVRELYKMLYRHGFQINRQWLDRFDMSASGALTPPEGTILNKVSFMRRNYAHSNDRVASTDTGFDLEKNGPSTLDPMDVRPLDNTVSPHDATTHQGLRLQTEPSNQGSTQPDESEVRWSSVEAPEKYDVHWADFESATRLDYYQQDSFSFDQTFEPFGSWPLNPSLPIETSFDGMLMNWNAVEDDQAFFPVP